MIFDGYQRNQENSRSQALGRTSTVSTKGSDAIFSNPGLLSNLQRFEVTIGSKSWIGKTTNSEYDDFSEYSNSMKSTQIVDHVSIAGSIWSISEKLNISGGIGYTMFSSWDYSHKIIEPRLKIENDYNLSLPVYAMALSLNLQETIAIGFTHMRGISSKLKGSRKYSYALSDFWRTVTTTSAIENIGTINQIGIFWDFSIPIKLCINYTWPHTIQKKESTETTTPDTSWSSEHDNSLDYSETAVIGLIISPADRFHLFVEYQESGSLPFSEDNINSYRIGLEYHTRFPIRIGWYSEDLNDSYVDTPQYGFTFGTEVEFWGLRVEPYIMLDILRIEDEESYADIMIETRKIVGGLNVSYTF